ncbi:amidohydrolase family protein [Lysobacter sp. GX 14042]|uniref:amidohydrolase family protein n=1 Tax=Lysobacter sp. GX 14042 TaxID=2907155 RepID=UPI001F40EE67|nr:amidohydrolase family protein [Lysobacter sp. GX 14042]MCE7032537.1 amidohydrolase family protein [Lysobacter sp. GX 14042]
MHNRRFLSIAWFAALLLAPLLAGAADAGLLIRDARVFDGDTRQAAKVDVLIEEGRIARIGTGLQGGAETRILDADGLSLVPGLFDLHTHWTPNTRPAALPAIANAYLDAGVTTVADYHQAPEAHAPRREWLDRLAAPTVQFGARVSTPLGHGADWADQATTRWVNSPDAARAAVREIAAYRPDFIKAFTDGWRYNNAADNTSMDEATLTALVDEAHRHGIKVFTHTVTVERGKQAARAGVDLIAHSLLDREVDRELVDLMLEHGTAYGPTLAVYEPVRVGDGPPRNPDSPVLRQRRINFATALANVKRLHEAGVPVVVATDAGMPGTPHGRATTRELELLVGAGLTPYDALQAATATAARVLGTPDRGVIAQGARADLVLVEGDPWQDETAMQRVRRVFLAGTEVTGPDARRPAANARDHLPPRPLPALIDDFERGDGRTALDTLRIGDADGGNDRTWQSSLRVPRDGGDGHVLSTHVRLSHSDNAYAAVILPLSRGSVAPAGLAAHAGVSFQARGEVGSIRVEIRGQDGRRWAHDFEPGPQWREYAIEWDDFAGLAPWGGGDPPAWRPDDALQIAFSVAGDPGTTGWYELDEVRLYGGPEGVAP